MYVGRYRYVGKYVPSWCEGGLKTRTIMVSGSTQSCGHELGIVQKNKSGWVGSNEFGFAREPKIFRLNMELT